MNYKELTGQESGIFIHLSSNEAIICNWGSEQCNDCEPMVFLDGLVWKPIDEEVHWEKINEDVPLDNWLDCCDFIWDPNNDNATTHWGTVDGDVYGTEDSKLIIVAPKGWN